MMESKYSAPMPACQRIQRRFHSINYLHHGEAKFWYSIPPEYARRFERMAKGLFPNLAKDCPAYLRHKMCLISPNILRQNSIPYNKVRK